MVFNLPENLYTTDPNFTTLFRLLDDFNSYSREVQTEQDASSSARGRHHHRRGPRPRFDIRETKDAYELYGEMPGVDRKDIHIELTGENVLSVRGSVERPYEIPLPATKKKGGEEEKEGGKGKEGDEGKGKEGGGGGDKEKEKEKSGGGEGVRFLQRERFVGDFERDFAFPGPLSELDIEASLENGILKVVAPKQQVTRSRKIEVK
ncbi:HSP20-like chaperone [Echria macrotheca]|uniref:HSP20-like chaperone n=1 Tax=Echria macrotheca TaxID=438768 RepID=A0AAJ0BL44_9PEZI|nr:HSP20-like chaperone [Echria macrotheca]